MSGKILLTGATGYIGGRLLPLLENKGYSIRCFVRRPECLKDQVAPTTELVAGDVRDQEALKEALKGITTAYYLIHSLSGESDFEQADRDAALSFATAATEAGVKRIIYVGGLGDRRHQLSKHLRSRQETGDMLRMANAQVIEFRASIVIGSGSLSFEMIRSLVDRLPVMICPQWVDALSQPIAIEDLLQYLLHAIELPAGPSQIYEVGGPDRVSYGDIMREYARQRGLSRWMIPVPVLTPYLSSLWLGLVTPLYARVGRKLIESIRNPTLVSNNLSATVFPVRPRSMSEAISRALAHEDHEIATTRWSDAFSSGSGPKSWGGTRFGSRIIDSRTITVNVPPEAAFRPIQRIGGHHGWYYGDWLWSLRGFLDLLVGGVGVRRGRKHPNNYMLGMPWTSGASRCLNRAID